MIVFPNAKVNIGLHVISKRPDGYHDLETCLYPIPWRDVLEIVPSKKFTFISSGRKIDGEEANNLCVRAYRQIQERLDIPPVTIHLHKIIPMGAGLGGGSSDAAFTLKTLNHLFDLQLTADQLRQFASDLGSDCPFFIDNLPAMAKGTGTELTPVDLDLSDKFIAILYPEIHVGTKEAYDGITPQLPENSLLSLVQMPLTAWNDTVVNDFEKSIFENYPELQKIKNELMAMGAKYAAMSGSGSAIYGIFDSMPQATTKSNASVFTSSLG